MPAAAGAGLAPIFDLFEAVEIGRTLALAILALNIWDIFITFDDEVAFFWTGPWSFTRCLFFLNRYTAPAAATCTNIFISGFTMAITGMIAVQAAIIFRIWYLFSHDWFIRASAIAAFLSGNFCTCYFLSQNIQVQLATPYVDQAEILKIIEPDYELRGCTFTIQDNMWRLFVPALILHTLLYLFTTLRVFRVPKALRDTPALNRLLQDGGMFYTVVIVAVGIQTIGACLTSVPKINIPAIFSNFMNTICSAAVTRLMIRFKSLAADLGYDEVWILSHVELQRLPWKKGYRDGEILVEIESITEESCADHERGVRLEPRLKESRAGVLKEPTAVFTPEMAVI
ncbi:hypothetical protein GYMLUDRAFT_66673 [Collybiopsis luxurians FD-317 M1]|nr:hypothetical protein GYMLUDRAFT_66673 [Collybiopsis luxurians FD-317 M1]